VTIRLRDGRRLQRRVHLAKGQPQVPLTDAELTAKFLDCATRVMPAARADELLGLVQGIEGLADVSVLARALAGSAT
jgi:MmgE/PrpD C-terminal domain